MSDQSYSGPPVSGLPSLDYGHDHRSGTSPSVTASPTSPKARAAYAFAFVILTTSCQANFEAIAALSASNTASATCSGVAPPPPVLGMLAIAVSTSAREESTRSDSVAFTSPTAL